MTRNITITYRSIDGAKKARTYKTLAGAQRFAHKWVGSTPTLGSWYAVSWDGIGRISAEGCTLQELFPQA